jgi:hypothetical protein
LQRVEDYGTRERRELQANVFAREFLFPRPLARRLHLDEALSASVIAERLALPKNLVRQQLLDALLLPTPTTVAVDSSPAQPLCPDPSQDRAAAHRGSAFQLQAGPGTGKTRTLVKRILSLISDGIDPAAILVLTFSNRAAGELVERLATATPDSAAQLWIGTFHAFGLDLLRRYHDRLHLPPNPTLFDRSDAISVLEEILPTLPLVHYRNLWDPAMVLRDVVTAISRAKDELADPVRYRELAEKMLQCACDEKDREAAEKCLEVAQIYEIYEQAMHEPAIPAAIVERDLTGLEHPIFRKRQGKMQWGTVTQKFSSPLMFFWTKGVEICMLSLDETKTIPATAPNRAREVAQCHGAQAFERRCPDQVGADLF